jgi:hypothetical protein
MYSGIPYSNFEKCIHYPNSGYSQFFLHPSQLTAHITALLHSWQHTKNCSTSWPYPRTHEIFQNKKACQSAQCPSRQRIRAFLNSNNAFFLFIMELLLAHSGRYSNYAHLNKNCQHQLQIKCVTTKILPFLYSNYFIHYSVTIYN